MSRSLKLLSCCLAAVALSLAAAACGTQSIGVPSSQTQLHHGAVLFSQRCSGCHTFSYAGTRGSAANVRTKQYNNGPNFNIRCERPVARVLYAIENGGFSGAIMPQNIVVGQDAKDVALFVATYSGRQAPKIPGTQTCQQQKVQPQQIDNIPTSGTTSTTATPASTTTTQPTTPAKGKKKARTPARPSSGRAAPVHHTAKKKK